MPTAANPCKEESWTMPTIELPDDVYAKLEQLARPFVDHEPADVIRRLVDASSAEHAGEHDTESAFRSRRVLRADELPAVSETLSPRSSADVEARTPRERGGVFMLAGERIEADSVRHLYEQALEYIDRAGLWNRLEALVPYKTSSKRYLVAESPVHPNGRDFFVPVQYRGLYMETHKNYVTGTKQLRQLLEKCGIRLEYGGTS